MGYNLQRRMVDARRGDEKRKVFKVWTGQEVVNRKYRVIFAGSSNGRTQLSGSCYLGSNPGPAAMIIDIKNDDCLPAGRYVLWNPDKIERAKNSLPANANEREILIEYDKIAGLVIKDGKKLSSQTLWNIVKQKQSSSLENLTDDEIDVILRKAENVNVPGSRYQRAKIESGIRHRKKIENSIQKPNVSVGILNRGENNKFINNTFEGFDTAIQDEGKNTLAKGNRFNNSEDKKIRWWEKTWIQVLFVLGALAGIVSLYSLFK